MEALLSGSPFFISTQQRVGRENILLTNRTQIV